MIHAEHISKKYRQGQTIIHALDDVSLDIEKGQTVAIVGPSGSGKSTLMTLLAGLDQPDSGAISFQGEKISAMTERELARFRAKNIGIVFQQFHLMPHLTALENVMLPLQLNNTEEAEQKAQALLDQVGLGQRSDHRPHQLSGGECQRVAIARATINHPSLLLADEPSGNLDASTGNSVMDLIFNLADKNQMTLVLVTHDQALANRCKRVINIQEGKV